MEKDWIGNKNSVFTTLGASNHIDEERQQHDYYATEPKATELLLEIEEFNDRIWECACGEGHMSEVLIEHGYEVYSTDLIDRGYGSGQIDFLETNKKFDCDIITNPPYRYAKEFAEKALEVIPTGNKVAMFLKVLWLESQGRREFFEKHPPIRVHVSSSRLKCAKNGKFEKYPSSATAYAWFIWEKGFKGNPTLHWFN